MLNLSNINKIHEDNSGILILNKPIGITSHDLVDNVRHILHTRRVGHAGALDPFAEGVMIVLVGKSTKLSDQFLNLDKTYSTRVLVGVTTDTLDIEGSVESAVMISGDVAGSVKSALSSFSGKIKQQVPIFSSVKVDGNKLRVLARSSKSFEIIDDKVTFHFENKPDLTLNIPIRDVIVNSIEITNISFLSEINQLEIDNSKYNISTDYLYPEIELRISCSKGFYVRQFAKDFGNKVQLGAGGTLLSLKRERIGVFELKDCMNIEDLGSLAL